MISDLKISKTEMTGNGDSFSSTNWQMRSALFLLSRGMPIDIVQGQLSLGKQCKSENLKFGYLGTSLVVQWLRFHLPVQGCGFNPWSGS